MRKKARYALGLEVMFCWRTQNGSACLGTGVTRDISTAGMFVSSEAYPPPSAELECQVTVPRRQIGGSLRIKTSGRVIRIEMGETKQPGGFVVIGDMRLADDDAVALLADSADIKDGSASKIVM